MYSKATNNFVNIAFVALLATSAVLLKSTTTDYLQIVMAGTIPLCAYFVLVFISRKHISPTHIDTVYYFGFLITIMTLGFSAYEFKTDGIISIDSITKQFSVGLIATGLALIFRLTLINLSEDKVDDTKKLKEHTAAMQEFREKVSQMFVEFNNASESLKTLTTQSVEAVSFSHEKSSKQLDELHSKSLEVISTSLEKAMEKSFEVLKTSSIEAASTIQTFNSNLSGIAKSTELKNVNKSLSKLSETFDSFNSSVATSNTKMSETSKTVSVEQLKLVEVVSSSAEASAALIAMRKMLEEEKANAIWAQGQYTRSMDELTQSITKLIERIEKPVEKVNV